jgi:biotin synthase
MDVRQRIESAKKKCLDGEVLSRDEIVGLLDIPVGSDDDMALRKAAYETAVELSGGKGYIWCAVGMDFVPCEMNCSFCSFGAKWNVIREEHHVTDEEIKESIRRYVDGGAAYIVLRTTEFYDIDRLLSYIPQIRSEIPGDYVIVLNPGELTREETQKIYDNGVFGVYHALRIREGIDTPFDPLERLATMDNIQASPLHLISLTEPIGPEHSNAEIAEAFLNTVRHEASIGGVMARFPVEGTPFENTRRLTDEEIAHITAALRLSGGNVIKDICVHPASEQALSSGANVMVVESGAIPRDSEYSKEDWENRDMARARQLIEGAGFTVSHI